ncbi:MAG: Acetyl-CoA decarbonylase/synthase complex subunit gamma [Methanomassiliicoccales archaeon PtaB.Bin215]|nr:MAG: Acetyl-CoA decarbonylase/synthase complex subunit gamma [Methanomassiliicoccales archaeon PtaB.Bin215]
MATAIEIFKHLPKKNCGDCKFPTCLAFAMQLANNKAKLDDCPHLSEAGRNALASSSAPPIRLIKVGSGKNVVDMGDETELYRHDKRFFHPAAFALRISDDLNEDDLYKRLSYVRSLHFERVGQVLKMDMLELECRSGKADVFAAFVKKVASETELPLVLRAKDPVVLSAAANAVKDRRPLLHGADACNVKEMCAAAKSLALPLVVGGEDLSSLASIPAGRDGMLMASTAVMKYGSLLSFEDLPPSNALPLMVLRQNIYTDPQVPIQVKPDLYPVNNPGPEAPLLFTTNFSLTFFTVMSDLEKSKVPVWLQVVDTEGLSVLTAYSAGKLTAESVKNALTATGAMERSKMGALVIPGMVARMAVKLNEATGLQIIVGPKESSGLPKFLRS